jgi:hypothetical protein
MEKESVAQKDVPDRERQIVCELLVGSSSWRGRRPVDFPDATFDGRSASYNCDWGNYAPF